MFLIFLVADREDFIDFNVLEAKGASKAQMDKILTNDIMVQFKWLPQEIDLDYIQDDHENKDINVYLKTVKQIFQKEK